MDLKAFKQALETFGKTVVAKSKKKLPNNKRLADTIGHQVKNNKTSFVLEFSMDKTGLYKDRGVKGNDPSKLPPGARKYNKQQAQQSPYQFGDGGGDGGKLRDGINAWITRKNIKGSRNALGQYTKRKTMIFLISRSIWYAGIKPSLFFTTPFEVAFKRIDKELAKSFGIDVEKMIEKASKDINKDKKK
jgi:hypothetical protein